MKIQTKLVHSGQGTGLCQKAVLKSKAATAVTFPICSLHNFSENKYTRQHHTWEFFYLLWSLIGLVLSSRIFPDVLWSHLQLTYPGSKSHTSIEIQLRHVLSRVWHDSWFDLHFLSLFYVRKWKRHANNNFEYHWQLLVYFTAKPLHYKFIVILYFFGKPVVHRHILGRVSCYPQL